MRTGGCGRWTRWVSSCQTRTITFTTNFYVAHHLSVWLDTTALLPKVVCPVSRQLLGSTFSNYGAYGPSAADVPLREWLDKVCGIDPAETGLDGTGRDMGAGQGLSFGPQYGRLQGEIPHNLNAHDMTSGGLAGGSDYEAKLHQMDKGALIAHILRNRM
jgi:hypothetical protein